MLLQGDSQGVRPWMYVLRRSENTRAALTAEAVEVLRLLVPPESDMNFAVQGRQGGQEFPPGWSPARLAMADPAAREVFGSRLEPASGTADLPR